MKIKRILAAFCLFLPVALTGDTGQIDPILGIIAPNSPVSIHSDEAMVTLLADYLTEASRQDRFSGVVLLGKGDQILFARAYGLANKKELRPNVVDTTFNLASLAKLFTIVAVAKLVEEGKVKLNAPLNTYLQNWLPSDELKVITVQQLLTHTSGLGDYMTEKAYQTMRRAGALTSLDRYRSLVYETPLSFEPGTGYLYSNSGYMLLGAIVEQVSGMAFDQYVEKTLFSSAGMKSSGYPLFSQPIENHAMGYYNDTLRGSMTWHQASDLLPLTKGMPDGNAVSTAADLFRFTRGLVNHKLLNAKLTSQVLSPSPFPGSENHNNAFGFAVCGFDVQANPPVYGVCEEPYLVGKGGLSPGESTYLAYAPEGDYTIIVLSNYTQGRTNVTAETYALLKARTKKR